MLKYALSLLAMLLNTVLASEAEAVRPYELVQVTLENFDCESLTSLHRFPSDWDWTRVGNQLKSEKCVEALEWHSYQYDNPESAQQLFEVAHTHPDIVGPRLFCLIAPTIVQYALGKDLEILEACDDVDKSQVPRFGGHCRLQKGRI